ncbi:pre-60S ribosomal particles component [Mucor circinelloides]
MAASAKKQVKKQQQVAEKKKVVASPVKKSVEKPKSQKVQDLVESASGESSGEENDDEEEEQSEGEEEEDDMDLDQDADAEDDEFDDDDMDLEEDGAKQPKKYSSEAFSDAMTKILASTLTGSDKRQPILARSKGLERKLEDEKLDYKARKIMSAEKKALKEKGRVIPDFTTFEYEKRLRKVATRGVVKLFNAIRTQQKVTEVAVQNAAETRKTLSAIEKAKNVSTMSKSSFLDLLKTGQK